MDTLIYQKPDHNINRTLNRVDKRRDSIKLSFKRLQMGLKLTKKQKQFIIRYISNDFAYNLSHYLEKRAIKFETEVGLEGCGWNILHFSAKYNALQCIQFILKQQFRDQHDYYEKYIHSETVQGYTAAMIAIISESNEALSLLLKYGAVDINAVDNKRMTAYELAINYKNQRAIRLLMSYQNQSKKQKHQSKKHLQQPIVFGKRQQGCCYKTFAAFFQCLTFGFYSNLGSQESKVNSSSPRRSSILNPRDLILDQVKISRTASQQAEYQIIWKDIGEMITNVKHPLFQNYNPFDISQKNIVIKNNLILFQCLSQLPWIVRKNVQIDKSKLGHFNVNLFIKFQLKCFNINSQVPFLKDRQQPMFIQNHNQMWPMLLQKGLAKAHGSYFDLEEVEPLRMVEQMTGFPTFQIEIESYQNIELFNLLKQIHHKGYLYLLQGTECSNLSHQGKIDCFSVLEFFDKNQKKLILVNCPFVDQVWKEKQKYEMHSLKLIKSHFNNHDQMCVWIQFDKIKDYFSKIIVSTALPNYERKSFKGKAKKQVFFTFTANKNREQNIVIQLVNLDTKTTANFGQIKGYLNEGDQAIIFSQGIQGELFTQGVINTKNLTGQYTCCIELQKPLQSQFQEQNIAQSLIHSNVQKKSENYMLIMWSVDGIQPRHLDQTLGPIQFLNEILINSMKTWALTQVYRVQLICEYALIIMKAEKQCEQMSLSLQVNQNDLIQGQYVSESSIKMVRHQDQNLKLRGFYYCIIRNAGKYNLTKKSSYIKDSSDLDPAGQSSIGKKLNFINP